MLKSPRTPQLNLPQTEKSVSLMPSTSADNVSGRPSTTGTYLVAVLVTVTHQLQVFITGWAVAQTCCISHSAKYRKTAKFDPSGRHGWLHQRPHPTCQLWWSSLNVCGLRTCVKYHIFVSFLFLLSSSRLQVAFLNPSLRSTHQMTSFRPRMCLWGFKR